MPSAELIAVVFEPIVDVKTGRTVAMQALPHPAVADGEAPAQQGWRSRYAGPEADADVLRVACEQLKEWCDSGLDLRVCVPVHGQTLCEGNLVRDIERLARQTGIDMQRLELGLTPVALPDDSELANRNADALTELGVSLCILGFGTGCQSLETLTMLPCARVELDESLVSGLEHGASARTVVEAHVSLFRSFGATVGAAGVDAQATAGILAELGVDTVRGSAYAYPMGPAVAHQWLLHERDGRGIG